MSVSSAWRICKLRKASTGPQSNETGGKDPRDASKNATRREGSAKYDQGAQVETPDSVGVVCDRFVFDTTYADEDVTASGDEPVYAVAVQDPDTGFVIAQESELGPGEIEVEDADPADVTEVDMNADLAAFRDGEVQPETATLSVTDFDYPNTWGDSPTPNRTILLKAYARMGASLAGVRNEMADDVANSEAFAAAMKDRVSLAENWRVDG